MSTEVDALTDVEASIDDLDPEFDELDEFDDEGQSDDGDTPPEQPILNLDEYADHFVDINGELVSIAELKSSGLRQADYTRKTQELAEQRRELEGAASLAQALKVNPQGTIQWLASQNGMSLAEARQAAANDQFDDDGWLETEAPDPLDRRLAAIESRFQQEDVEREFSTTFAGLKAKYGEEFNAAEVAAVAIERGIHDPSMMEMVYRDIAFGKITAARTAATEEATAKAELQERRRVKAAADAARRTGGGSSARGTTHAPAAPDRPLTRIEALEQAWTKLYGDAD